MRYLYRHTSLDLTIGKIGLAVLGLGLGVYLVLNPPERVAVHMASWIVAGAFGIGGLLALLIRPRVHILITETNVIVDPDGPFRRIPFRMIHHVEINNGSRKAAVVLVLRNGERLNISDRIGRNAQLGPLFDRIGVLTRDVGPGGDR